MKKFITILLSFAAMMLLASCNKSTPDEPAPPEPFTVEMAETSVHISVSSEGALEYVAANYKDVVHVSLPFLENITLTDEYDTETGTGVIHFSTSSVHRSSITAKLSFNDGTDTVEKDILIQTSSSWSIEPDNPIEATE